VSVKMIRYIPVNTQTWCMWFAHLSTFSFPAFQKRVSLTHEISNYISSQQYIASQSAHTSNKHVTGPVTGRAGQEGCETSSFPRFFDNRLTDGGEVVSLTHRQAALYPNEYSWYPFLLDTETTRGP
jgi:hypothetical protein